MSELDDAAKAVDDLNVALERGPDHIDRTDVAVPEALADYRQPWDQMEGESDALYAQFVHYRDQGLGRTVSSTHAHFNGEPKRDANGTPQGISYVTSNKYEWKRRAASWDNDQERQYQLARSEAIRDMVHRHESDIEEAIDALMTPVRIVSELAKEPDFIESLSKTDARKLISMANQAARTIPSLMSAERLARGMPTEIVGGTIDHNHIVTVERDHIGEILEVLAGTGLLDERIPGLEAGDVVDAEVVDVYPVPADDHE